MMKEPNPRILISRPDRIGDVVLSTSIPRLIKQKYPEAFVAVLLREYTHDIYVNNPWVDEIVILDPEKAGMREIKLIRSFNFTHALMLLPNEKINYLLFFAGIKTRIGVGHKFYQFITNVKSVYRRKYKPLRHEADYCLDTVRKIGIPVNEKIVSEIYLDEKEKVEVAAIRENLAEGKEYVIGIHTTSGASAPNWKPGIYRKLIDILLETADYKVVVTDNNIPAEVKDVPGVDYPNVNSKLRETIKNIAALDVLVSASTGPMHIAAALGVKTVSLFCPLTACSPELWAPKGNISEEILPVDNFCLVKCPGDPHLCHYNGEEGISVETVKRKISSILKENFTNAR